MEYRIGSFFDYKIATKLFLAEFNFSAPCTNIDVGDGGPLIDSFYANKRDFVLPADHPGLTIIREDHKPSGGVRQPSVFVLVDRLDIFVFFIDIVFEAFADVVTQVSVNWGCWFIRINVVSEFVLLEHRI